jgi:hypothetical protein
MFLTKFQIVLSAPSISPILIKEGEIYSVTHSDIDAGVLKTKV